MNSVGVVVISSAILSLISLKRDLTVGIESPTAVAASEIDDPLENSYSRSMNCL